MANKEAAPEGGYIAYIEEIPGVNTQGETLEEARMNLREALELVLDVRRELAEEQLAGRGLVRGGGSFDGTGPPRR